MTQDHNAKFDTQIFSPKAHTHTRTHICRQVFIRRLNRITLVWVLCLEA